MAKKKYYPNNWEQYNSAPDDLFEEINFIDFMLWKCDGWEIPSSVCALIREENEQNGKIKIREYVYQRPHAAKQKIKKLFSQSDTTFCVVTKDSTHEISSDKIIHEIQRY